MLEVDINLYSPEELDRLTDEWLQENDPYFSSKKKNKRKSYPYTYETYTQTRFRERREFPFSSLSLKQTISALSKNFEVGYLELDGGFRKSL